MRSTEVAVRPFPDGKFTCRDIGDRGRYGEQILTTENTEPENDVAIAMVATTSDRLPDAKSLQRASRLKASSRTGLLSSLFRRQKPDPDEWKWEDTNLVAQISDAFLAIGLMPAPIPWSQLEGPCSTAWWWPDAESRMKSHAQHFVVALQGGSIDPVARRIELARIISAVVEASDAVGVFWAEGTLVSDPKQFRKKAKSASVDDVPIELFVDVRGQVQADGSSRCFTTGMSSLGFFEIEIVKSKLDAFELMEFVLDMARYIVNGNLEIPEGNTMGRSATEQYIVRYGKSLFDRGTVMQLEMA
jgi:hypothetical protein